MAYLIDGNNLIGQMSPQDLQVPGGRYPLVAKLIAFHRLKRVKIFLVFDGPPDLELESIPERISGFQVLFPQPGEKADSIIKDMLSKRKQKRRFFVVSSDREIRDFAQAMGFKTLTSLKFQKELKLVLKAYKKIREERKENFSLSRLDIDQWLDVFGGNRE